MASINTLLCRLAVRLASTNAVPAAILIRIVPHAMLRISARSRVPHVYAIVDITITGEILCVKNVCISA